MKKALCVAVCLAVASAAQAAVVWQESFENGLGSWTANGTPTTSTEQKVDGSYSAKTTSSADRIRTQLTGDAVVGKAGAEAFTFTTYIYDGGGSRGFSQLTSYSAWGSNLLQMFAIGKYNNADVGGAYDGTKYQGRITHMGQAGSWFNLDLGPNRSVGWHKFDIVYDPATKVAEFYVDDVLGRSWSNVNDPGAQGFTWVSNGLGAGSTGETFYYDSMSISVVPEPATLALLAFGGLFLRRRRA